MDRRHSLVKFKPPVSQTKRAFLFKTNILFVSSSDVITSPYFIHVAIPTKMYP